MSTQEIWSQTLARGDQRICTITIGRYEDHWALTIASDEPGSAMTVIPIRDETAAHVLADTLELSTNLVREAGYQNALRDANGGVERIRELVTATQNLQTQAALILSGAEEIIAAQKKRRAKGKKH